MISTKNFVITVKIALLATVLFSSILTAQEPRTIAKSLVDRGRTYGLQAADSRSVDDAEMLLVWMQAASRVDPELAESYLWQHNVLSILMRPQESLIALSLYQDLNPSDISARLALVDLAVATQQTVESRMLACLQLLERQGDVPEVASDLHRRIAEMLFSAGSKDEATAHASKSVQLFPRNVRARRLLSELDGTINEPSQRVGLMLDTIANGGARGGQIWELAGVLDFLSLHEHAARWYQYGVAAYQRAFPGVHPPIEIQLDWARNLYEAKKLEQAFHTCNDAIAMAPDSFEAQLMMIRIAREMGRDEVAEEQRRRIRRRFATLEPYVLASGRSDLAADIAWFHLEFDQDPVRALSFSEIAANAEPGDARIQRIYGLALLMNNRIFEAEQVLAPLVNLGRGDQLAAAGVARAYIAQNKNDDAIVVLREAEQMKQSGLGYEKVLELLAKLNAPPAPGPDRSGVARAVKDFDDQVLRFEESPADYLSLEVAFPSPALPYGQPWEATFRLTNKAPFPITIGGEGMVSAELLVSLNVWIKPELAIPNYLPISLNRKTVLMPREYIEFTQTLDVGPAAAVALAEPQRTLQMTFHFTLDPVQTESGEVASYWREFYVPPLKVKRVAFDATRAEMLQLLEAAESGSEEDVIRSVRIVAGLLGERKRSLEAGLDYGVHRVDEQALTNALFRAMVDESWKVRASAADALRLLPLEGDVLQAASALLTDEHWLVRLNAVDVFAEKQGPVFAPVLFKTATDDGDILVKLLANLHLQRLGITASAR
jgi:tetratricopeptide (TPR) repeat protein